MAAIERRWNAPQGTLCAYYSYNEGKERNKLEKFTLITAGGKTDVHPSTIFINDWPLIDIKKFKHFVLPEEGEVTLKGKECFHLKSSHLFETITIKVTIDSRSQPLSLTVYHQLTIRGLKKMVAPFFKDSSRPLTLTYEESSLDTANTVEDCDLDGATISACHLVNEEKKGREEKINAVGLESVPIGFDCMNPSHEKELDIRREGPPWQSVCSGLNLEGECANEKCDAFRSKGLVPKKFGTFNMGKESKLAECVQCNTRFSKGAQNYVFFRCIYSFSGMKEGESEMFEIKEKSTPANGKAITYEEIVDGESQIIRWSFLEIITKQLTQ